MTGLAGPLLIAALAGFLAASTSLPASWTRALAAVLTLASVWMLWRPGRKLKAKLDHFLYLDGALLAGRMPFKPGHGFFRRAPRYGFAAALLALTGWMGLLTGSLSPRDAELTSSESDLKTSPSQGKKNNATAASRRGGADLNAAAKGHEHEGPAPGTAPGHPQNDDLATGGTAADIASGRAQATWRDDPWLERPPSLLPF